jgi:hypothetical protein
VIPESGIRTYAGVVPVVHVLPETSSDERMHVMDTDHCWCHPEWHFEGDMQVRIVHQDRKGGPDD